MARPFAARALARAIALTAVLSTIACGSSTAPAPVPPGIDAIIPSVFSVTALPKKGCEAAPYREFDFWLGKWDVYSGTTFAGTNTVERELDGCIVEENWVDGFRGRSINVYDASVKRWSQMWTYSGGGPGAFVLLEGGLANGTMHIEGSRFTPTGTETFNTINWTPLSGGRVRQFGEVRNGTGPLTMNLDLEYRPVSAVTSIPLGNPTTCATRAQSRQLDFMVGTWGLRDPSDATNTQVGTTTYSTDLNGCLVEERVTGPDGYAAWSFNTWHTVTQKWHRMYVDNRGFRLALSGAFDNGAMVMTGRYTVNGTAMDVRVTWKQTGTAVAQTWEISRDGAKTWQLVSTVNHVKTA